jgi:non-heme chloroperoxidase
VFATINGVRLHYADWGGAGPWLVFLTPGGGSLDEQFGSLAPQFVDRFRVVGLTRRGQPPSAVPAGPYDTDTLVRDLLGVLDLLGAQRARLAGHSIAGAEMTRLAATHPTRVATPVYLDAAVDYKASAALARGRASPHIPTQPSHPSSTGPPCAARSTAECAGACSRAGCCA